VGPTSQLIVLVNQECPCPELVAELARREATDVHLVAPALNGRFAHFVSDVDAAIGRAHARLRAAGDALTHEPARVTGEVGDSVAHTALADAVHTRRPDAVLVLTDPEMPHWQERRLLEGAGDVPVEIVRAAVPVAA